VSRVLVTGAGGFIGRALCPALKAAGHDVAAALRSPEGVTLPEGVTAHPVGDIGPATDWTAALDGVDAVVHLAARVHVMEESAADPEAEYRRVNVLGTRRLAEACAAAGVRRLVFLSTVKVNGEATKGPPFRETDPPAPKDPYGRSKLQAEEALAQVAAASRLETVVVRPPLVYGPGVKGNFLSLLALCRRAPPLPLAAVENRRSLIFVGNLCDALVRCLSEATAAGETFLVRDGDDLSTPELVRRLAAALGRPSRLFPVPAALLRAAGVLTGKSAVVARLLDSLVVDDGKIRRALSWAPPYTVAVGLDATAAWFLSRGNG